MDVHNLCFHLRRRRELVGPRSLRFRLRPGQPLIITIDPWGTEVACPRSRHDATTEQEIRVWGRRRLFILERLIPFAHGFKLFLLGTGLPTFWLADLGDLTFTLGLSGWTRNDWASAANFDLMATRGDVDDDTRVRVFDALATDWVASVDTIAAKIGRDRTQVAAALNGWVQAGRAIYDLEQGVYRRRELTREPLPIEQLRFDNPREAAALEILHGGKVAVSGRALPEGGLELLGRVRHERTFVEVRVVIDVDARVVTAECGCDYYVRNKLYRGPCEHMLAVRLAHRRGISDIIEVPAAASDRPKAARPATGAAPASIPATPAAPATPVPADAPAAADAAATPPPRPGFFRRLWNGITGRGRDTAAPAATDTSAAPLDRHQRAVAALATVGTVRDRDALLAELRTLVRADADREAWIYTIVAAAKRSPHFQARVDDDTMILTVRVADAGDQGG
jgi:hypothetical protein